MITYDTPFCCTFKCFGLMYSHFDLMFSRKRKLKNEERYCPRKYFYLKLKLSYLIILRCLISTQFDSVYFPNDLRSKYLGWRRNSSLHWWDSCKQLQIRWLKFKFFSLGVNPQRHKTRHCTLKSQISDKTVDVIQRNLPETLKNKVSCKVRRKIFVYYSTTWTKAF